MSGLASGFASATNPSQNIARSLSRPVRMATTSSRTTTAATTTQRTTKPIRPMSCHSAAAPLLQRGGDGRERGEPGDVRVDPDECALAIGHGSAQPAAPR